MSLGGLGSLFVLHCGVILFGVVCVIWVVLVLGVCGFVLALLLACL